MLHFVASPCQSINNNNQSVNSNSAEKESLKPEKQQLTLNNIAHNNSLKVPSSWSTIAIDNDKPCVVFSQMIARKIGTDLKTLTLKQIVVDEDLKLYVTIIDKKCDPSTLGCPSTLQYMKDLQVAIENVDKLQLCPGVVSSFANFKSSTSYKDICSTHRHIDCSIVNMNSKRCNSCEKLRKAIYQKRFRLMKKSNKEKVLLNLSPKKRRKIDAIRSTMHNYKKSRDNFKKTHSKLKKDLRESQKELAQLNKRSVDNILRKNTSQNLRTLIRKIVNSSKVENVKGRRYSDEWILLSLLLHMKSPACYNFLRDNEYLLLPCVRTIRRYLSMVESSCGFDEQFFQLLKKYLELKSEKELDGVLLIDEMATRESMDVSSKNLTYRGLIDFGGEINEKQKLHEKANYGLVMMYQSLTESYSQPVCVFASHGPVPGITLSQLIIKCIVHLEKAGARIHGVVSDGASTNRKFWDIMGINGDISNRKNVTCSFPHPYVVGRKIYVFSDTPHLIKCIRNRMNGNNLRMHPHEPLIQWNHFQVLYKVDNQNLCPKITARRINLNNLLKMRVNLAVQIFSNSVARGLSFYKTRVPELKDCDSTIEFCQWMNNLFDALNKSLSSSGITLESLDFKVLQDSLTKLDNWEKLVHEGLLSKDQFLSKQTAEGLRVSLNSMMELVKHLILERGYSSVATGRISQDPLERFFGTIRQTCSTNDHPTHPTFLQIYKILSIFSVLKPPRKGNCSVSEKPSEPLISLSDLKLIYYDPKSHGQLSSIIKEKIEKSVARESWDFNDIIDNEHDYGSPEIGNCIAYCLTSYIAKRMTKINCSMCKDAVSQKDVSDRILPSEVSTNVIQNNFCHPNKRLYRFILKLENLFMKHCDSPYIRDLVLDEAISNNLLIFPCDVHKTEILSIIVAHYLQIRLRQFCTKSNSKMQRENLKKKKLSKLCTS